MKWAFMKKFQDLNIKTKLIIIFIFIKVIPVLLVSFIALFGINQLFSFFNTNSLAIKKTAQEVATSTATIAIEDSILALDKKSQNSLEILSSQIAQAVANFLYERDHDLLFLAQSKPNKELYQTFFETKKRHIMDVDTQKYAYNETEKNGSTKQTTLSKNIFTKQTFSITNESFNGLIPNHFTPKPFLFIKRLLFWI